ncbi:MAG: hypothetical protein RIC80_11580 [Cyclobacteriaceae bacterium]
MSTILSNLTSLILSGKIDIMDYAIFVLALCLGFLALVLYTQFRQKRDILYQKIFFLNRELHEVENKSEYILKKSFFAKDALKNTVEPTINKENMDNPFYSSAIEELDEIRRNTKIVNSTILLLMVILLLILQINYPDFIKEVFENDPYSPSSRKLPS